MSMSLADLERHLSLPRFNKYRTIASSDAEALCLYIWNMELSECLQPSLHMLEVVLRNSIHAAAIGQFGRHDWFRNPATLALLPAEVRGLNQARDQIWQADGYDTRRIAAGLDPTPPLPAPDRHLAALTLNFWVALFKSPYRRELWSNIPATAATPARANLLPTVFPYATLRERQQYDMRDRLVLIRDFRNRISHHEPIWNWAKPHRGVPDVAAQYRLILRVLRWISPASVALLSLVDRFPAAHARGYHHYLPHISLAP